jgi:hypothetical protein
LVVDFNAFELEDFSLELVDDDVLLVVLDLRQLISPNGGLSVVQVFAVHAPIILKFIKRNQRLSVLFLRYNLTIK